MVFNWRKWVLTKSEFFAIEVFSVGVNKRYSILHLKHKKNKIEIIQTYSLKHLKVVSERVGQKPLLWIYNTHEVLHYVLDSQQEQNTIPEFSGELFFASLANRGLVLCKKTHWLEFQDQLKAHNLPQTALFLGMESVFKLLHLLPEEFFFRDRKMGSHLELLKTLEQEELFHQNAIPVGGVQITSEQLVGFTAAILFLAEIPMPKPLSGSTHKAIDTSISAFHKHRTSLTDAYANDQFFKLFIRRGVGVLLVSLLLVFFGQYIVTHWHDEKRMEFEALENQIQKVESLEVFIQHSKTLLSRYQVSQINQISPQIDALLSQLPEAVTLHSLIYQPLQEQITNDSALKVAQNVFLCSGNTTQQHPLNTWIQHLKELPWVATVRIEKYSKKQDGGFLFTLEIKMSI